MSWGAESNSGIQPWAYDTCTALYSEVTHYFSKAVEHFFKKTKTQKQPEKELHVNATFPLHFNKFVTRTVKTGTLSEKWN